MCLSTVYKNEKTDTAMVMKNVMKLQCRDGLVILTDLMDRTVEIPGMVQEADLVNGYVIVRENP